MKRILPLLLVVLLMNGCLQQADQRHYDEEGAREWVKIQFNVPDSVDGYESYWLYGRVLSDLLNDVIAGVTRKGLISMVDTRVYGEEGYRAYEDEMDTGALVLRVEDIVVVTRMKGDPLVISASD